MTNISELEEKPWRFFMDSSYYDYWAIQHKDRRAFNQAIHVNTEAEARFLVDMLNSLTTKDQEIERLKGDCRTMASWFKDLIEDEYPFNEDDYPAYTAAMRYITPDELTLTVWPEDSPCSSNS